MHRSIGFCPRCLVRPTLLRDDIPFDAVEPTRTRGGSDTARSRSLASMPRALGADLLGASISASPDDKATTLWMVAPAATKCCPIIVYEELVERPDLKQPAQPEPE